MMISLAALFRLLPWSAGAVAGLMVFFYVHGIRDKIAQVPILQGQIKAKDAAYATLKAYYDTSEARRRKEASDALTAVTQMQKECDSRVQEMQRSANSIRTITHVVPTPGSTTCKLMDHRQLSDALGAKH